MRPLKRSTMPFVCSRRGESGDARDPPQRPAKKWVSLTQASPCFYLLGLQGYLFLEPQGYLFYGWIRVLGKYFPKDRNIRFTKREC